MKFNSSSWRDMRHPSTHGVNAMSNQTMAACVGMEAGVGGGT